MVTTSIPDLLSEYQHDLRWQEITAARAQFHQRSESTRAPYREALATFDVPGSVSARCESGRVVIGDPSQLNELQQRQLDQALHALIPWKKGPWSFFGTEIDAEWRSDLKWDRIAPLVGSLKGLKVADIGCNNGYFMYRMAEDDPQLVVGVEPVVKHYDTFQFFQRIVRERTLQFEPLGVEHMDLFPGFFDVIYCLGILYHHTDPIGLLRKIRSALAPGGRVIIDCQGIPGDAPVAYVPPGRYAQARGIWFLPTRSCLENWIRRAQFSHVNTFYAEPLSTDEQRSTEWAPIKSLADFLDPTDSTRTIEGHPAPHRFYVEARP